MKTSYNLFSTTQTGPALGLEKIVQKHARTLYLKPIASHQTQVLELARAFIKQQEKPIILDSGCGTGLSSTLLAQLYPDHCVLGFDKSKARLSRLRGPLPNNCLILRADLIDMWRLLAEQKWEITQHYMFFPNPWPKASQIKRRFHAHPVFSTMAGLASSFELRTNWRIYADECALALGILGHAVSIQKKSDSSYMTLFEKKYVESGSQIFIVKSVRPTPYTYFQSGPDISG